jgi:hypothetical protein
MRKKSRKKLSKRKYKSKRRKSISFRKKRDSGKSTGARDRKERDIVRIKNPKYRKESIGVDKLSEKLADR